MAGDGKGAFRNLQSDHLSRKRGTQGRQIVIARGIGLRRFRALQLSFEAQGVSHRLAGLGRASVSAWRDASAVASLVLASSNCC